MTINVAEYSVQEKLTQEIAQNGIVGTAINNGMTLQKNPSSK
jgi:hypothetical protein